MHGLQDLRLRACCAIIFLSDTGRRDSLAMIKGIGVDAQLKLIITSGSQKGQTIKLKADKITIGRGTTNDIVLNDMTISKHHVLLSLQAGAVIVRDLASTNGTFVNGKRVSAPAPLKPGDELQVGANVSMQLSGPPVYDKTMVAAIPPRSPEKQSRAGWRLVIGLLVAGGLMAGAYLVWRGMVVPRPAPAATQAQVTQEVAAPGPPPPASPGPRPTPSPAIAPADTVETRIIFEVDQSTLRFGDCARVTWAVENSSDVRLDGEAIPAAGSRRICPQKSEETHILTALTAAGAIKEAAVTLTVLATPTPRPGVKVTFFAEQGALNYKDCTTLRWQVENAQSVTLNGQLVDSAGSREVCPREAFNTYRLLVLSPNSGGSEQTVVINVPPPPPHPPPSATAPHRHAGHAPAGACFAAGHRPVYCRPIQPETGRMYLAALVGQ